MSAPSAQATAIASAATVSDTAEPDGAAPANPACLVIDADHSVRRFLALVLYGAGIDAEELAGGHTFDPSADRREPDVIFLNVGAESSDAIACVERLGHSRYAGHVQLMSNRGPAVLAHVKSIGEQHGLRMLPVLKKPFETNAVLKILHDLKLGETPPVAGRIDLDEALAKGWIEFCYQPKIDLRKKQLAGAEAFARARHPQHGLMMPSAFLPGAADNSLVALAELTLTNAIRASLGFAKLGVHLRLAADIPLKALAKTDIAGIVRSHLAAFDKWPGLIIDVAEEQILTDLPFASAFAKQHAGLNVKLAIDDFGRGYSVLAGLNDMPFAELKLDRAFVIDCGTDKAPTSHAAQCRSVIELAHEFGSAAVAIGIEKASDALALVAMGCDYGQGFLLGQPMSEERFISLLQHRAGARPRQAASATLA
jgi:EAL domain-containing protein (putative c-di-GMP-specific phosphodiesterase class I)